jgi:macrolide-specific efflux system membrane fusion protein
MKADGKVESRNITIGIKGEISTEVKSGLKEKEMVVTSETSPKKSTKSALSAQKGR